MPKKNIIKTYIKGGFYHLYNRGVDKRTIFEDEHDYSTFLFYLKLYLSPPEFLHLQVGHLQVGPVNHVNKPVKAIRIKSNIENVTLHQQIQLIAYCLMPNHFHLLIKQNNADSITKFIRRLSTAYSMVFNKRHQRIGPLFEGNYKAVLLETDEQLLQLSRYIHRNPISTQVGPVEIEKVLNYPYSSLSQYLGRYKTIWLNPQEVLAFFNQDRSKQSYLEFVKQEPDEKSIILLNKLSLEK